MDLPPISPLLVYRDPRGALGFLERALGFETRLVVETEAGVPHSESVFEGGVVVVVGPPMAPAVSPLDIGGRQTGHVHVNLKGGIDELCERARAAGARIQREPADQPYGDRAFTCLDPEGHSWSFGQTIAARA